LATPIYRETPFTCNGNPGLEVPIPTNPLLGRALCAKQERKKKGSVQNDKKNFFMGLILRDKINR
jgi:hypothetical protein